MAAEFGLGKNDVHDNGKGQEDDNGHIAGTDLLELIGLQNVRHAVGINVSNASGCGHAGKGCDKGRNVQLCDEEAAQQIKQGGYGNSRQNRGNDHRGMYHQNAAGNNACDSDHGADRQVDTAQKNDKRHAEGDDTLDGNLSENVHCVRPASERRLDSEHNGPHCDQDKNDHIFF